MKKTLVAGAASLALAAMPVVGVFATTTTSTVTDTLSAKISSACVFTRASATAGDASQVDTTTGDVAPAWTPATSPSTGGTYSATFKPGNDVELGTSSFSGYCNDTNGFTVTVTTPALSTAATGGNTLPFLTSTPSTTTSEGWTITKDKAGTPTQFTNTGTDTTFMKSTGPTDSDSAVTETATYTVYTTTTTKSGTYTGDVVYTFTYDDPA